MMAVALEQQAALPGRTGRVKSHDRLVAFTQHAMLVIDRQPAFGMHEHRAHRSERHIGPVADLGPVAGAGIMRAQRLVSAAAGIESFSASDPIVGLCVKISRRLRR